MVKKKKLRPLIVIALVGSVLIALLVAKGVIVFDNSAERRGEGVYWNEVLYVLCSGEYTEGKTIAKTKDGSRINEVEEDNTHTFIVIRSFIDQNFLVRDDYQIPTSGTITTAFWNEKAIKDEAFYDIISEILEEAVTDFEYETDGIYQLNDKQKMRSLYVGYDDCPIATSYIGYLGMVDGTWYITTEISSDQYNVNGSPKPYMVSCYTIPEEYIEILEDYFS